MDSNQNDGMRRGLEPSAETVYGTHEDNTMVMSEKVRFNNFLFFFMGHKPNC